MALQTTTSHLTTSSPTSTATSNENTNKGLSLGGSPPLILAFLAIGLLFGAMIAVFGWRRFRLGSTWVIPEPGPRRVHEPIGKRPELWDVWSYPSFRKQSRDIKDEKDLWRSIMVGGIQISRVVRK